MKRLLWLLLLVPTFAFGQSPVTITGTITDSGGNLVTSGTVEFDIMPNSASLQYYVNGVTALGTNSVVCNITNSGTLANLTSGPCTVWGNDVITPANTTYNVTYFPGGQQANTVSQVCITGSTYDLSRPVFCPVVNIIPQYSFITAPVIQGNLVPNANNVFTLGNALAYYSTAYIGTIFTNSINSSNSAMGYASLVSGVATVSTTKACNPSSSCVYKLTNCGKGSSTGAGTLSINAVVPGTSFTINSLSSTATVVTGDSSFVCWQVN